MRMIKSKSELINKDELVYYIGIDDLQDIAKERIGRKLEFDEIQKVKKGIEWGFVDWDDVVKSAIDEAVKEL